MSRLYPIPHAFIFGFILSNPSIPSENGAQPIKLKDSRTDLWLKHFHIEAAFSYDFGRDNFSSNVAKKQELDYRTPATPSSMPMASSYQGEGPSNNNLYPKPHCYNYNADMPMITSQHTKNTANPYIPYPVEPPCRSENSMEGQRDGFRDKFGISAYDKPSAPQSQYGPSRGNHPSTVRGGPYALQSQLPRDSEVVSISKLALYMPKWQIQGRVTNKTDLKTFRNEQSEGQVFSIDIKDRDGEIRGTFFHKVAEKWYTVLTLNRVYAFANGQIKPKKMPFNTLNHPYEIVFDENSTISLIADELGIPKMTYDFVRIRDLTEKEVNSRVDIAAIVMKYKEIEQITRKDGQKTQKREVSLLDDSHASIALTIWGNKVTLLPEEILNAQPVVCFKGVKLGDWRGRKLDTQSSTLIECAPTDSYSIKLKEWFNRTGNNIVVENVGNKGDSMSNCKSIEEITKETANTDSSIQHVQNVEGSLLRILMSQNPSGVVEDV
ncbi:hypothetical protein IE077_004250 [Cardiosporidium cionae]|uniref:Uncharacterized protein n=1 Tax=Cardiosporidium cionae TaxID=476202 RepID=A0ABQ7JD00_9APIC|nr:hypothetical protein IE077_004250 [Cardiosporidium cionae]|eukprot:KAF8821916.1 hypothetical protein IE077_004250 [Cardiosporidium cionae]